LQGNKKIKIFYWDKSFNYSAINNYGRTKAKGEVLVFLNNDTEVISPEWLTELASVAKQKDRGAVGAMLQYPDGTLQHAGVVVGMAKAAGHVFRGLKPATATYFGNPIWPRDYLAVTGACVAVEAKKFDEIKGFDESIIIAGSDVVLCLQLYKKGYLNVYWPSAKLKHHESKSVKSYKNAPPTDYEISIEHYRPYLDYKDPYYNPNLDLDSEWPKLRSKYE
jgi:GT2 family glycosyltransferase